MKVREATMDQAYGGLRRVAVPRSCEFAGLGLRLDVGRGPAAGTPDQVPIEPAGDVHDRRGRTEINSRCSTGPFQRHVVLLLVVALLEDQFVRQVAALSRFNPGAELRRPVVGSLRTCIGLITRRKGFLIR